MDVLLLLAGLVRKRSVSTNHVTHTCCYVTCISEKSLHVSMNLKNHLMGPFYKCSRFHQQFLMRYLGFASFYERKSTL